MKTTVLFIALGTVICALGAVLLIANHLNPLPNIGIRGLILFYTGLGISMICLTIHKIPKINI
jgi:hypothetical protein